MTDDNYMSPEQRSNRRWVWGLLAFFVLGFVAMSIWYAHMVFYRTVFL